MDPTTPLSPPPTAFPQPQPTVPPPAPVVEVSESVLPQVADVLQKSKNVLVTVGINPSVDELAAALGLTVLLGQLGKHATAVFSGKIPPAIEFLDPEKTFEDSVDSLRDFIIALDKEKADKLRYKVEDDVVKIFITPYRTIISEKDLDFSQGDFNVDVVVALGVEKREELDKAITAHGRILHDATFVTVNAGEASSTIGTLNWNDAEASSIAEMLVHLSGGLGENLLDSQISTAFLTGIVAETNRFSNEKTTPKVMTMSAQLMAAGANQQLIASNLRQEGMISESVRLQQQDSSADDGEMVLNHKSDKTELKKATVAKAKEKLATPSVKEVAADTKKQPRPAKEEKAPSTPASSTASEQLIDTLEQALPVVEKSAAINEKEAKPVSPSLEVPTSAMDTSVAAPPSMPPTSVAQPSLESTAALPPKQAREKMDKPVFGGKLNSFTDNPDAQEIAETPEEAKFTLTHNGSTADVDHEEALEAARKAVEEAAIEPPHKRLESIGAAPFPEVQPQNDATVPAVTPPQSAVTDAVTPPAMAAGPIVLPSSPPPFTPPTQPLPPVVPQAEFGATPGPSLPPMPPMPASPVASDSLVMPPLPPQPLNAASAMAPQTAPSFLQDLQASQNPWTQAGKELADTQASAAAERQAKIDDRMQNYEQAVDRTRELNGLPPLNNPQGSGLPPVPPANL